MTSILRINNMVVESRLSDGFVNATQLCTAGGKKFNNWHRLDSTLSLIEVLRRDIISTPIQSSLVAHIPASRSSVNPVNTSHLSGHPNLETGNDVVLVDIQKGGRHQGSWVHPDLAIQLAQWISPTFAVQVSRWVRELALTGSVSIDTQKTEQELLDLQRELMVTKEALRKSEEDSMKLHSMNSALRARVLRIECIEKTEIFYISTTPIYAASNLFEYGGVKSDAELVSRLSSYNTGRAEGDLMYYTKVVRCARYKDIEARIGFVLASFKDKIGGTKEMFKIEYGALVEVVNFISEHYEQEIDFFNSRCNQLLETSLQGPTILPQGIDMTEYMKNPRKAKKTDRVKDDVEWTDAEYHALFEEVVTKLAREKIPDYDFNLHKYTVKVHLNWRDMTPHFLKHQKLALLVWRDKFKAWYHLHQNPELYIRGLGVKPANREAKPEQRSALVAVH